MTRAAPEEMEGETEQDVGAARGLPCLFAAEGYLLRSGKEEEYSCLMKEEALITLVSP